MHILTPLGTFIQNVFRCFADDNSKKSLLIILIDDVIIRACACVISDIDWSSVTVPSAPENSKFSNESPVIEYYIAGLRSECPSHHTVTRLKSVINMTSNNVYFMNACVHH